MTPMSLGLFEICGCLRIHPAQIKRDRHLVCITDFFKGDFRGFMNCKAPKKSL
jgi:hypothetical protein